MARRADLIAKSIEVERLARDFYERLKLLLPQHSELWDRLIDGENHHISIIEQSTEMILLDKAVDDIIFPCIHMLKNTCESIKDVGADMESRPLTLEWACECAQRVENSTGENYLQASIKYAKSPALLKLIERIGLAEQAHGEMIKRYLEKRMGGN